MNHNFADLNSAMWTAIELETDRSKLINHYFPIPEQYTSEEAFVSLKHLEVVYLYNVYKTGCILDDTLTLPVSFFCCIIVELMSRSMQLHNLDQFIGLIKEAVFPLRDH